MTRTLPVAALLALALVAAPPWGAWGKTAKVEL